MNKICTKILPVRDRPFNLGGGGGYGFLFRSEFFFPTTRELENLFFVAQSTIFFLQNSTLGYMTITLNQIIFFVSLHQNQNIFFSNIGNQNIFLEKKHNPLQVKWSFPNHDTLKIEKHMKCSSENLVTPHFQFISTNL